MIKNKSIAFYFVILKNKFQYVSFVKRVEYKE